MKHLPPENLSRPVSAERSPLPVSGDEREVLTAHLDWHRATFEAKCAGLSAERLSLRAVPPSSLSLHGLIRHTAGGERWWFRIRFAGEEPPLLYYSGDDPDQDFDDLAGDPAQALDRWREEVAHARRVTAASPWTRWGRTAPWAGPPG
ncbi:hypothetical protein SUDANB121_02100 [Nocardiopsis dassonvillei]|uniref:mycothiol transferase n=1 Tax=Nocardiopsis dassonvillei TaxID=2014 RepID=UPI003F569812